MKATITHCDTCLPDYANRCYDVAIPVDGTMTIGDVLDCIIDDVHAYGFQTMTEDATEEHYTSFGAAMLALKEDNADSLDRPFDSSLEPYSDDDSGESVYAYFDVTFEGED